MIAPFKGLWCWSRCRRVPRDCEFKSRFHYDFLVLKCGSVCCALRRIKSLKNHVLCLGTNPSNQICFKPFFTERTWLVELFKIVFYFYNKAKSYCKPTVKTLILNLIEEYFFEMIARIFLKLSLFIALCLAWLLILLKFTKVSQITMIFTFGT